MRERRLNGELGTSTEEDVAAFRVSSSGYVAYRLQRDSSGVSDLFSAPADGSAAPTLLSTLVSSVFEITPDGDEVVFSSSTGLQVRRLDGTTPSRSLAWATMESLAFSGDGARLVYRTVTSWDTSPVERLYSADFDGSGSRRIDGTFVHDPNVVQFRIHPDSTRVVFTTGGSNGAIWVGPIDGSHAPQQLALGWPYLLLFSSDGQHVLFSRPETSHPTSPVGLYTVPLAGGPAVHLNPGGSLGDRFGPASSLRRPTVVGTDVFFRNGLSSTGLFRAPADGSGSAVRLDAPRAGYGVERFQVLPGGTHVVYSSALNGITEEQLFRAPTDGSQAAVALGGTIVSGGGLASSGHTAGFATSPDGSRVVFVADSAVDEQFDFWSVPSDGSALPVKIGPALAASDDVLAGPRFTADGQSVLFNVRRAATAGSDLYLAAADPAGAFARLNDELVIGGEVLEAVEGPGDPRVVYRADREQNDAFELFGVRLATPGAPVRLNDPLAYRATGRVADFLVSDVGPEVVYKAHLAGDDGLDLHVRDRDTLGPEIDLTNSRSHVLELLGFTADRRFLYTSIESSLMPLSVDGTFSVPLDGSDAPLQLTPEPVFAPAISPDGRWVAYAAGGTLRSRRTDGSSGEIVLAPLGPSGAFVHVAPDGEHVLFTSQGVSTGTELFSTRLDGSTAPVRISVAFPPGRGVFGLFMRFSPDGTRVLHRADAAEDNDLELFVATVDGSAAAIRLGGPLLAGGDVRVEGMRFTPDGTQVVYAADTPSLPQLFVVPVDGSSAARQLSLPAVSGTLDLDQVVVDDTRAFYVGGGYLRHIFRARLDGTVPPQRFTLAFYVRDLTATPGVDRVLFRTGERQGVFAAAADGTSLVHLSPTVAFNEDVYAFRISRDGRRVVYAQERGSGVDQGLYVVPVDGSQPPRHLTPGLPSERRLGKFAFTRDGNAVVYQAENALSRHELYMSYVVPPYRAR